MTGLANKSSRDIEKLLTRLVGKVRLSTLLSLLAVTLLLAFFAAQVAIESNEASMVSQVIELQNNYASFLRQDREVLELSYLIPGEL